MKVVTGPSRSGTSLVCQLLAEVGADFHDRDNMLPPDRWNPRGYFENRDIVRVNHALMFGRTSSSALWAERGWTHTPVELARRWSAALRTSWSASPRRIEQRAVRLAPRMHALAARHFTGVVKDPRFAFTLPAWQTRVDLAGVLFCVRDPAAVSASIAAQTACPRLVGRLAWEPSSASPGPRPYPHAPAHPPPRS